MRQRIIVLLAPALLCATATSSQVPQAASAENRIEVVEPTFSQLGVVETPAQLRIAGIGTAQRASVSLDRSIERVVQVLRLGDAALVIGKDKYAWTLQRIDLVKALALKSVHCNHPQPLASPDCTRVAYVAGDIGRGDYSAYGNVVMVMDLALDESTPVFPEENAAARKTIVREPDDYWHEKLWGNFLWRPDGMGILFVAARGIQWWNLDLCLVDLSSGPEGSRVARRRLDFSSVIKKGHGPSDSCKFIVNSIEWAGPNTVKVKFDGCLFVTSTTLEVAVPILSAAAAPAQPSSARLDLALDKDMPGGFTALGRTPWQWVRGSAPDGSVLSVPGERVSYFSEAHGVHIDVRYAMLASAAEAAQALSTFRSSNRSVEWRELPTGSAQPCESGGCWSSTDRGLFRLLTLSGRVCILVTAYGREVLPGEQPEADADLKERDALAMAQLIARKARYQLAEQ